MLCFVTHPVTHPSSLAYVSAYRHVSVKAFDMCQWIVACTTDTIVEHVAECCDCTPLCLHDAACMPISVSVALIFQFLPKRVKKLKTKNLFLKIICYL